jgi:DNA gyrase subunit A
MADYPRKGRPTQGVRTIKVSDKKGELVTARPVREGQELLLISMMGQVIRIQVGEIRRMGRSTEGVRLMVVGDDDQVSGIAPVEEGSDVGEVPEAEGSDATAAGADEDDSTADDSEE